MNDLDLLYMLLGIFLFWLIIEAVIYYENWIKWNYERLRDRKRWQLEFQEILAEGEYRAQCRNLIYRKDYDGHHHSSSFCRQGYGERQEA